MQIKLRIAFGYTLIALLLLLTGCGLLYYYTLENKEQELRNKLLFKAVSTYQLHLLKPGNDSLLNTLNANSASTLEDKSILICNAQNKVKYRYDEDATQTLKITTAAISKGRSSAPYYYKDDIRTVLIYTDPEKPKGDVVIVAGQEKNIVAWMATLRTRMIIGIIAFIVIFFIAGYMFSKRVVRSISKLTEKLTQISSEAFSARLTTGKEKDELWELATTINNLLDRLQSSFDTQRRFLSNASHELTTPLAAISSQLDVALHKERSNEEYKKVFLSVKDDVKRLALLVRSILEIAKASGSVGGIDLTKVRIDELLMRIPGEMKKISQLYDVKLNFEDFPESEGFDILYGNEALLYSALRNVIHNACKFSKDKCAKVSLTYTYQNIVVEVKDNGPGISAEELQNIFQPFFRGYKYENTNMIHGTGLGLALAHRIIELHKGDIYVESVVGEGSTFSIFLPVDSTKTYKK
ncbi:MAG: ATP-binding protein [Flavipsychrobacter sp.]